MDPLNVVPKKVHRHVIKALEYLNADDENIIFFSQICSQVKYQMRNLVPVDDLECKIKMVLDNLVTTSIADHVEENEPSTSNRTMFQRQLQQQQHYEVQ